MKMNIDEELFQSKFVFCIHKDYCTFTLAVFYENEVKSLCYDEVVFLYCNFKFFCKLKNLHIVFIVIPGKTHSTDAKSDCKQALNCIIMRFPSV